MQHWEILIVPLIALGVWILGTLFKGGEDDRSKKGARRPGTPMGRPTTRRPTTDLDRFLEEARRRREAEARPKPPPAPAHPTVAREPLRERPSRPRPEPRPTPPTLRSDEGFVAVPVARPVEPPPPAEPVPVVPAARETRPALAAPPAPARETRPSPITQQVRSLLSKPQTAGTAFVLREIFDRPLCRRRRR